MLDLDSLKANWNYPTSIRFGLGRIHELASVCKELGFSQPLFVTDPGMVTSVIVKDVLDELKQAELQVNVFSNFKGNPTGSNVEDGVAAFRSSKSDGVIAFGGGSALDVGKAIAFMVGQERPIWDFEDIGDNFKRAKTDGIAPLVAVPTTAGTGSEVGRASVITNEQTSKKTIIFHPRFLPRVVISDPVLTAGLPPHLTAATGMDALAHCLEALSAPSNHPLADGIAIEGVRLIKEYLPRAYHNGSDMEARSFMLTAASMGGAVFQKGLGAVHSLSHPIGARYDTHHGLTNAVLMPYVLKFNRLAIEDKMARLAAYLALPEHTFDALLTWLLQLREELHIPHTLKDLGVGDELLDEIAQAAFEDPSTPGNAIPVTAVELRRIFVDAIEGRL